QGRGHHSKLQAVEVLRDADRLSSRPRHGALGEGAEKTQPFLHVEFVERRAYFWPLERTDVGPLVVAHDEVQQEDLDLGDELAQVTWGSHRKIQSAVVELLKDVIAGAQGPVGIDDDFDLTVRALLH